MDYLIVHVFPAVGIEVAFYPIGFFTDMLYQVELFGSHCCGGRGFIVTRG